MASFDPGQAATREHCETAVRRRKSQVAAAGAENGDELGDPYQTEEDVASGEIDLAILVPRENGVRGPGRLPGPAALRTDFPRGLHGQPSGLDYVQARLQAVNDYYAEAQLKAWAPPAVPGAGHQSHRSRVRCGTHPDDLDSLILILMTITGAVYPD